MSRATVVIELAGDAEFSRDLAAGGVFVPGCALRMADECDLVVCGQTRQLLVPARVVYVDEDRGAGLELIGFSNEMKARLAELGSAPPALEFLEPLLDEPLLDSAEGADDDLALGGPVESALLIDLEGMEGLAAATEDDLAIPVATDDETAITTAYADAEVARVPAASDRDAEHDPVRAALYDGVTGHLAYFDPANPDHAYLMSAQTLAPDSVARHEPHAGEDEDEIEIDVDSDDPLDPRETEASQRPVARNVQERLRGLTLAGQLKVAVIGEQHERIALERLYGKNVWETLLKNPRLTPPEVARIARYGSLPRVLLEIIIGNTAWLQVPEVRRALLSNPRLGNDQIMKVLRLTPKHELKLAAIQTAYPHAVRAAAKLILRSEDR